MSLTTESKLRVLSDVRQKVNVAVRLHAKGGPMAELHLDAAHEWAYVEGLIEHDIEMDAINRRRQPKHGASEAVSMTEKSPTTPEPPRTALSQPDPQVPASSDSTAEGWPAATEPSSSQRQPAEPAL